MKFSIVIPTYNASRHLKKALDSVIAQTCRDYDIIAIDGASSDGTQKILKEYEKKFEGRLRWISEPDRGVYDAMNKGIDMARGEWIYFLGSDDTLHSGDVLEKIAEEIEKSDPDVIYGNVMWGKTGKIYDGKFSALKLMRKNICHQALFFRKNIFEKFGKYDLRYKFLADHVYNMEWFNDESVRRKYVDLVIANYSLEGQSSASSAPDKQFVKDWKGLIEAHFPKEYYEVEKNVEISEKLRQQLEQEIELMKASKFWKLRNYYLKLKSFLSFKNHS